MGRRTRWGRTRRSSTAGPRRCWPDKAVHCRELGITDFVDDRDDVLDALRGTVERRYLFGPQSGPAADGVTPTPDWPAVTAAVAALIATA